MNAQQVAAQMQKHLNAAQKAAEKALYQGGNIIMTEAKQRAPVDLGTLRNSGYVTLPQRLGGDTFVEVGFGGAAKAYAVAIHEGFYKRADGRIVTLKPRDVGENKYLNNAINAKESEVLSHISKFVEKALETGRPGNIGPKRFPQKPEESVAKQAVSKKEKRTQAKIKKREAKKYKQRQKKYRERWRSAEKKLISRIAKAKKAAKKKAGRRRSRRGRKR